MKEFLSREKIQFEERNVMEDRRFYHELVDDLGYTAVPVTLVDGEPVVGFDPGQIKQLMAK